MGGVHFTVRAVGYWSYEKEVPVTKEDVQRNNNNGSSKVGSATTTVCVDYDTTLVQHPELNSVLPSSSHSKSTPEWLHPSIVWPSLWE